MKKILSLSIAAVFLMALSACGVQKHSAKAAPELAVTVHLAGDSTCSNYKESSRPRYGWGEKLGMWLPKCTVDNRATSGRSTKSFIDEGRWAKLLEQVTPGDLVLVQFGHNDEKSKDPKRYTEPFGSYYDNLCRFVADVRGKGGVPVLLTPICRRGFTSDGKVRKSHKEYPDAMKKAAADTKTPLIDMEQLTLEWLESLGKKESEKYFMYSVDGKDNTHLTAAGAEKVSGMVADALNELNAKHLLK